MFKPCLSYCASLTPVFSLSDPFLFSNDLFSLLQTSFYLHRNIFSLIWSPRYVSWHFSTLLMAKDKYGAFKKKLSVCAAMCMKTCFYLLFLDPETLASGGWTAQSDLLSSLHLTNKMTNFSYLLYAEMLSSHRSTCQKSRVLTISCKGDF